MMLIISEMKNRIFTILMAAILIFIGCGEENTGIHDPVEPDETGIPEIPADPQKENTSFTHRIMLLQHTGTGPDAFGLIGKDRAFRHTDEPAQLFLSQVERESVLPHLLRKGFHTAPPCR